MSKGTYSGHGGNIRKMAAQLGCLPEDILDFSANINPLGPPDALWNVLAGHMQDIVHYPDPESAELVQALADQYQIPAEQILPGNGTSDLLYATLRALSLPGRHGGLPLRPTEKNIRRAVIPVPAILIIAKPANRPEWKYSLCL
ncbi:hypothetical protein VU03_04375 [Desulfobulbus sp. N3]|nr:hypothetical protein [Desulfobulbus sp. N3]